MQEQAHAKLNLTLRVLGRRRDGYHILESLVVFTKLADAVSLRQGGGNLTMTPNMGVSTEHNICTEIIRRLGLREDVRITKNIPVKSGLGGGSADAAALLYLAKQRGYVLPLDKSEFGADVPVCYQQQTCFMGGIGEQIHPVNLPFLDTMGVLLVQGKQEGLSTETIFERLGKQPYPDLTHNPPKTEDRDTWLAYMRHAGNDLVCPARLLLPVLKERMDFLKRTGALYANMTGSGACCFGLYATVEAAKEAEKEKEENWWAWVGGILDKRGARS